jgi:hypothetical protein
MLLGMPHRKNRKVTRLKGTSWPDGKSACDAEDEDEGLGELVPMAEGAFLSFIVT